MEIFDVGIIGYGPAGITAAIYAARKKLRVVLIGEMPGGEVRNSGEIENWPGDGETNGVDLAGKMISHLKLHQAEVVTKESRVRTIEKLPDGSFNISAAGEEIRSKTVIYTTGRHPRQLGVPGEEKFRNMGVSYCATCDAPLFQDKPVAVIGGGNTGAEAVIMLKRIAAKIYLLHIDSALKADPVLIDNIKDDPKVEIIMQAKTKEIKGETFVTGIVYEDQATGKEKELKVEGVFVTIGAIANTEPVKNLVKLDPLGGIEADRYGYTNIEGFFAAGDVTNVRDAQIIVAAGQGCSAALSAGDYLARRE